jgi:DNA-binding CsgD family transcriptional regulator
MSEPAYLELWTASGVSLMPLSDEREQWGIGRDPSNYVEIVGDGDVSRTHALLFCIPTGWAVRDLSSRNGTFVNGERIMLDRPLSNGDDLRVGRTRLVFRRSNAEASVAATNIAGGIPELTKRERDVLIALIAPTRTGELVSEPASTREIAAALFVSEAAVKQHLAHLYDKFEIFEPERRRARLANEALRRGAIRLSDLRPPASK